MSATHRPDDEQVAWAVSRSCLVLFSLKHLTVCRVQAKDTHVKKCVLLSHNDTGAQEQAAGVLSGKDGVQLRTARCNSDRIQSTRSGACRVPDVN